MLTVTLTSDKSGQLCITDTPFTKTEAERMGKTLFFAPCRVISPLNLLPQSIINFSIYPPKAVYEKERIMLIFLCKRNNDIGDSLS